MGREVLCSYNGNEYITGNKELDVGGFVQQLGYLLDGYEIINYEITENINGNIKEYYVVNLEGEVENGFLILRDAERKLLEIGKSLLLVSLIQSITFIWKQFSGGCKFVLSLSCGKIIIEAKFPRRQNNL